MSYDPAVENQRRPAGSRVATAFFDDRDAAEKARLDLLGAGLTPDAISVAGPQRSDAAEEPILPEDGGFWHALKEFFMPDEDRYTYAEGLRRGGFVLSVRTDPADYDRAVDILDADGAIDIDQRAQAWRSEGWNGFPVGVDPVAANVPLAGADASTAGFGASYAGEDGYQTPQPRVSPPEVDDDARLTVRPDPGAEVRADASKVGTGTGESGLLNPDMRERIGSGTASMTPPTPTGAQDAAFNDNAASFDRGMAAKSAAEDASLGSPTRSSAEAPAFGSTIGSTVDAPFEADWESRRDTDLRRARVRGFILDPRDGR